MARSWSRRAACALAVAFASLATAGPASAAPAPAVLYGAQGGGGINTSDLYRIDPATGASTTVGPIGYPLTGMSYNPVDGKLYGVTTQNGNCTRCLITIDPKTGAGTVVGPLNGGNGGNGGPVLALAAPAAVVGGDTTIADIAFRADGTLFGWSENSDDLARIDPATGHVTVVSDSQTGTAGDAMDFTLGGVLHAALQGDSQPLYTVDTETGAATAGPTITATPAPECPDSSGFQLGAGATDPLSGTFYVTRNVSCTSRPNPSDLLTLDVNTGQATRIGSLTPQTDAIAFVPQPDVVAAVSAPASAVAGQDVTSTVTVRNDGAGTALGVTLHAPVPAGTTLVSATQTGGPAFACTTGAALDCSAGRLAAGQPATFSIVTRTSPDAPNGSTVEQAATVATSTTTDGAPANNTATATTTLAASADLSLNASAGVQHTGAAAAATPVVRIGDTVRFSVELANDGPSTAHAVTASVPLPAGTTFVSRRQASGPAGTCTAPKAGRNGTVRCTVAALAPGSTARFVVTAKVGAAALKHARLRTTPVVSSSTSDPATGDNHDTVTLRVLAAKLGLTTSAEPHVVNAGATVRFALEVRASRTAARDVVVCSRLPRGMTFASARGAQFRGGAACWTIDRLAGGASRRFTVVARAERGAAGRRVERASATGAGLASVSARTAVQIRAVAGQVRGGGVTG